MVACASASMGKHYDMPTHAYLGNSDSHVVDAQSGFESGMGLILATLARINIVSGPGMLGSINCQSLEKLVLDDEICASAFRLIEGVDLQGLEEIATLVREVGPGGQYLNQKHTRTYVRKEHHFPSDVISRLTMDSWKTAGSKDTAARAHELAMQLLESHTTSILMDDASNQLDEVLNEILTRYDIPTSALPNLK
jgi:trimethylamine--corrinoid protein Co-methyltransferase